MNLIKIIIYFSAGLGLLLIFRLGNLLLHSRASQHQYFKAILKVFPFIEFAAWVLFLLWLLSGFFSEWEGYMTIMIVLITIIILTISWYFLRDFIAGMILKSESAFTKGQQISTGEISGTVKKVGYRSLELESETGQFSKVPYSLLATQIYSIQAPAEAMLSHDIILEIPAEKNIDSIKEQIIKELLLSPWVSVNHTPEIKTVGESVETIRLKVIYHTSNDNQASAINQYLRSLFEGK